jgi:hypothetical protein
MRPQQKGRQQPFGRGLSFAGMMKVPPPNVPIVGRPGIRKVIVRGVPKEEFERREKEIQALRSDVAAMRAQQSTVKISANQVAAQEVGKMFAAINRLAERVARLELPWYRRKPDSWIKRIARAVVDRQWQ